MPWLLRLLIPSCPTERILAGRKLVGFTWHEAVLGLGEQNSFPCNADEDVKKRGALYERTSYRSSPWL